MHPTLIEFSRGATLQTTEPARLLAELVGGPVAPDRYAEEYADLLRLLEERYRQPLPFRTVTQLSDRQSWMLYAMVRDLRPSTVVETGIANGHSTVVLLSALRRNGRGQLVSFDIDPAAGALVPPELRPAWKPVILPVRGERAAFRRAIDGLGPIDLFEHDSDHSFEWQSFELDTLWPRMRPGGILSIDDADWSWAALDFARRQAVPMRTLVTTSRVCAVLRRP